MNKFIKTLLILLLCPVGAPVAHGKNDPYQISGQIGALAPNAGGQQSFSLRLAKDRWEASLFSNQYLLAGSYPLTGVTYDRRFPICSSECWWQFFLQAGGGISNGGPIGQLTWGAVIPAVPLWLPYRTPKYVPAFRIDMTTQLIVVQWRAVTWSYPFWFGVSFPF